MANETPPVLQAAPNSPENALIESPNQDRELNNALSTFFNQNETPNETPKTEVPKEEIKADPNLEKQPEAKPEAKREVKPPEAEKPLLNPDEVDKIDPKEKGAWGALKSANKRAHSMIEERDSEIKKLKAVVAERGQMSQKELDALKAENGELSKYRAMIDVQADPEFQTNFDKPMNEKLDEIGELLMANGVSKETAQTIDYNNSTLISVITKQLAEAKDDVTADDFRSLAREARGLINKRNKAAEEQGKNYKEILETRKKQSFEKGAEDEGKAFKHLENIASGKDSDGNQKRDPIQFLNKMTPKETATQPEIDQINAHNKMVEMLQQKVHEAYKQETPEGRMEAAVAAAAAHYFNAQNRALKAENESLKNEIKKISVVSNETEKPKAQAHRNGNGKILDTDEALAAHDWSKR